jgi:hypothetical protein
MSGLPASALAVIEADLGFRGLESSSPTWVGWCRMVDAASNKSRVMSAGWVGCGDYTHWVGGFTCRVTSRLGWPRLRRFQTMYPVCFGLSSTSRTLPAVHGPTRRPLRV